MKTLFALILLSVLLLSVAAVAEQTPPMQEAAGTNASIGEFTPEIYPFKHEEDNQTWVRKYEGERDAVWSLGTVEYLGYNGGWQAFLDGAEVFSGNTLLRTELGYSDNAWLQAYTSGVSRRTPLIPFSPAVEPGEVLIPVLLTPTSEFIIDRREDAIQLTLRPVRKWENLEVFGLAWREDENGDRPFPFRTRVGTAARPNRTKFETTEPVDQLSTESGGGTNFRIGTVNLSYAATSQSYSNSVTGPVLTPDFNPAERVTNSRFQDTKTHNHVLKLGVPLSKYASLTGNWISRDRSHSTAGIVLPDLANQIVPTDVHQDADTKNLNLRYIPYPDLLLTARWRDLKIDRDSPIIALDNILQNQSVNRHEKEGEVDATFTGLRQTMLRGTVTLRSIDRDERPVHEPVGTHVEPSQEEWDHPPLAASSDWTIIRLGATTYVVPKLTVRANWKKSDVDQPGYHGQPSDVSDFSTGATYSISSDFVVYADYRRLNEKNDLIPPPGFLNLAALSGSTNPIEEYTARRESDAGAQYHNKVNTLVVGAYRSITNKLSVDLNYMLDDVDSSAVWILGIDANFPPHVGGEGDPTGLAPESVPYTAKNKLWQIGTTYLLSPKWTLRSNFLRGTTDGLTTTTDLFRLVPPVGDKERDWQPINVDYYRVSFGGQYRWHTNQQILLEWSHNVWNDDIEQIFDGKYNLVTVALQTKF